MKPLIKQCSRSFLAFLCLAASLFMAFSGSAQALTQQDIQDLIEQHPYYDPTTDTANSPYASCTVSNPLSGATPGKGAPDGAQFPNLDPTAMANAINAWILKENPNSELKGLGPTIVASAKNANVSPFLIVAIASQESSLGDPTDYNVKNGNNSFGRTAVSGQPSFQGSHTWYKWSSVKASVDYTAPENQGAVGGGDEALFLRSQYGSLIDSGSLLDVFNKYAPAGDGNDPVAYAAKVQSWINDMVQLAGGQPSTPTLQTTSQYTTCPSGTTGPGIFAGDIVKTAIGLAWPSGQHGPSQSDATPAYQKAMPQYNGVSSDYSDCGVFVATVMIASGADPNYPKINTWTQAAYVKKSSKYQIIPISGAGDTSKLQPGDILIYDNGPGDGHTFIYVGNGNKTASGQAFQGDSAAASQGGHVPEASSAAASFSYNGRAASGKYFIARLIK